VSYTLHTQRTRFLHFLASHLVALLLVSSKSAGWMLLWLRTLACELSGDAVGFAAALAPIACAPGKAEQADPVLTAPGFSV